MLCGKQHRCSGPRSFGMSTNCYGCDKINTLVFTPNFVQKDAIRQLAYLLWIERGGDKAPVNPNEDWCIAEERVKKLYPRVPWPHV